MSDVPERPGRVRGSTRSVGVLGWPVDHSLSPVIHNAAFVALGLDWVYVPLPVAPAELPAALEGLGALGFAGANVTMPHKTPTAELIDDLSEDARLLRAVNTIVVGADGLAGHNSDAAGFERFLRDDVGFDASGRSALLFGAGGGARACALAAARSGLANLSVAVREASRADDLRAALEGSATAVHLVGFDDAPGVEADLIVNATPLGVHGEELPAPVAARRRRRGGPPLPSRRHPVPDGGARCGRRRVRGSRALAAAGRDLLRAVDRTVGAAPGDVGGGAGRARRAGSRCPGSDRDGLSLGTVRPPPDGRPSSAPSCLPMVPKEAAVLGRLQRARVVARARHGRRSRLSDPVPRRVGPRGASGRVGAHHHARLDPLRRDRRSRTRLRAVRHRDMVLRPPRARMPASPSPGPGCGPAW